MRGAGVESESAPIYRTAPRRGPIDAPFWHSTTRALLKDGHSFLPLQFSVEGHLFRGLRSGLGETLTCGWAGHFSAEHSLGSLEKKLGVFFVSNTPSDALNVAGLERDDADAGIVVFPASVFNGALEQGRAGVLAYAEGGLIFRYPFLCQAPALKDAAYLLINAVGKARIEIDTRLASRSSELERCGVEFMVLKQPPPTLGALPAAQGRLTIPPNIPGASFEASRLRPPVTPQVS